MKTIEITKEQAIELMQPKIERMWMTGSIDANKNEHCYIHTLNAEPITQEGIEGLGFSQLKLRYQFEMGRIFMTFEKLFNGDNKITITDKRDDCYLFYGELETMQELKKVLKQVGVL